MSEEHETFIKTPKQLIVAIVLAFIVPIALIALLVSYVGQTSRVGAGADTMNEQAVTDRIRPVSTYELASSASATKVHSGEEVYAGQCAACHAAGVAGAPKFGDEAQWAERLKGGLDPLVGAALKGKGAMAAQAGGKYSDLEIAKAVVHMANSAGGDFKEPTEDSMAGDNAPGAMKKKTEVNDAGTKSTTAKTGAAAGAAAAAVTAATKAVAAATSQSDSQAGKATNLAAATKPAADASATPSIVNRAKQAGTSVAAQAGAKAGAAAEKATAAAGSVVAKAANTATSVAASATTAGATATEDAAASAAARVAAAASAASAVSASVADEPAVPTTADKLVFTDASEVKPATGEGIPKRLSIFFDSGSSAVSEASETDLWNLIYFTKSGDWSRIGLSGFTDGTGNKEINERLSKQRMTNVRDALIDMGVAEDRIVMIKPEQVEAASGASQNARRVEVFHSK